MSVDRNKITNEEIQKMIAISPNAIPLNPSQQGWSGSRVKEYLSKYIFDGTDGLIVRINGKLVDVNGEIDDVSERLSAVEEISRDYASGVYATKEFARPKVSDTAPLADDVAVWIQTSSGNTVTNDSGEETYRHSNDVIYDGETLQSPEE